MNLQLNDPSIPAPGEMAHDQSGALRLSPQPLSSSPLTADPHHHRAPSLGELHQELEAEQEAHVVGTCLDATPRHATRLTANAQTEPPAPDDSAAAA